MEELFLEIAWIMDRSSHDNICHLLLTMRIIAVDAWDKLPRAIPLGVLQINLGDPVLFVDGHG